MESVEKASVAIVVRREQILGVDVLNFGDPLALGAMLRRDYNDRLKIWSLIQLGNMMSIGEELGQQVDLESYNQTMKDERFRLLVNRQCIAKIRDRGDDPEKQGCREYRSTLAWGSANIDRHRYLYDPHYGKGGWMYGEPGIYNKPGPERPVPLTDLDWGMEREREIRAGRAVRTKVRQNC